MFEHKSILLANKINTLAILLVIGSILFYSASKYSIQETFNTIYPRIPGWIELDDDVGRDIVSNLSFFLINKFIYFFFLISLNLFIISLN